jgi:hypothetical protein
MVQQREGKNRLIQNTGSPPVTEIITKLIAGAMDEDDKKRRNRNWLTETI